MSDEVVRIAKPHDSKDAEFQSVLALVAEGGEVETAHLAERLRLVHRIALKVCGGKLACVGAMKRSLGHDVAKLTSAAFFIKRIPTLP
jgi:hypothetical protein